MANNRHEEQNEHEESEYHFSDDEVNYEVETETEPAKTNPITETNQSFISRISGFKKLIVSGVVFFVLIIAVYRMLAPSTPAVPEIAPVATTGTSPAEIKNTPVNTANLPANINQVPNVIESRSPETAYVTNAPSTPGQTNLPINRFESSNTPSQNMINVPTKGEIDAKLSTLALENEKRINQMYADYNQKLNDYAVQNKQLQDEIKLLNVKIGSVETQMNQLTQVLINQNQSSAESRSQNSASATESKLPFNVQAIIPGRAWLKAENGDTITVAEGDLIKGLGRVTKIDPYDGIVEVNTGNKALSLSYGNNG